MSTDLTSDRFAVVQIVNTFGLAIDTRNWDQYRSLFADQVEFDYSAIGGPAGTFSPEEITEAGRHELGGFEHTQHCITNHVIEVNGDQATCEAHVRAMHYLPAHLIAPGLVTDGDPLFENGGHYSTGLTRSADGWKINQWTFSVYWSRGNGGLFAAARSRQEEG